MIQLSIDGKKIGVEAGSTVLQAAHQAGITIPCLCDHPALAPTGECGMCQVEILGSLEPCLSCTLLAEDGMVVQTSTDRLLAARQTILANLFSQRSHICPVCQVSGGDCQLQNAALQAGMTHWPVMPGWNAYPVDMSHPNILLDNNRCILCQLCVRACRELVGNSTLSIQAFDTGKLLVADNGLPLGESSCVSCGTCVQVCPTGALIDRDSAFMGSAAQLTRTSSICLGCSVGCGIQAFTRNGRIVRIEGDWAAPVNDGLLCQRGRFKALNRQEIRLESPMIRKNGELISASWNEALEYAASQLRPLLEQADGVAAMVSTRLPVEDLVVFEQLFRQGFGSSLVTSIEEGFTQLSGPSRGGAPHLPFEGTLDELKNADAVLVIGASFYEYHEVAGFFIKRMVQNGGCLVVIDPRENPLDAFSRHVLRSQTCKDSAIMNELRLALIHIDAAAPGKKDQLQTSELDIPAETILAAARELAGCDRFAIVYGKGITMQDDPANLAAMYELAQVLGKKSGIPAAIISVKGKANSLAADQLKLVQKFRPGGYKAAYLVLGDDKPGKRLMRSLQEIPLVIAQAAYHSKLTEMAHVVFPVTTWYEQAGHYLNLEGRLQKANAILLKPVGIRSNRQVLESLAEKLDLNVQFDWRKRLLQEPCVVNLDLDHSSETNSGRVYA